MLGPNLSFIPEIFRVLIMYLNLILDSLQYSLFKSLPEFQSVNTVNEQ